MDKSNLNKFIFIYFASLFGLVITNNIQASYQKNLSYCPPVETIQKEIGGYNWTTKISGWSGFYIYPQLGKGNSYTIKKLYKVQWIQSHNTINSAGFVQCDYLGDYSMDAKNVDKPTEVIHEIIRLEQKGANGAYRPVPGVETSSPDNGNNYWACKHITSFPKVACTCYTSDPSKCGFKTHS
tara:strand:- start:3714 stop:4259 length:546 start_codon:yes stop_codon:yes gene_type:complete